jgi:hypothetical protein
VENIKNNIPETGWQTWIGLIWHQDRDMWQALGNMVKLWV